MPRRLLILTSLLWLCCHGAAAWAQARATATPVAAVIITPTPQGQAPLPPTSTVTLRPSPAPAVRLRALSTAGNINVRALPSLESEVLGIIADATEFQVLRKYFRWYEFRYDASPNGLGWVYGDLVEIVGDSSLIEVFDDAGAIERTGPGDSLAADGADGASARTISISTVQADSALSVELGESTALPTFTRPAPTAVSVSVSEQIQTEAGIQSPIANIPPILPIAVLGGLGLLGLLISAIRP